MWVISNYMLMSLPSLDFKATSKLRPGSLIEYEYCTDSLGVKTARALALVVRVEWTPKKMRSYVVATTHTGVCNITMSRISAVLAE